jgi:hypothetical protein
MPAGAVIGSVIGGGISAGASIYGANKQAKAADKALALQQQMFERTQANLSPFVDTGKEAIYSLGQLYGLQTPYGAGGDPFNEKALEAFRKSPDYAFRFAEGQRALTFSDEAQGMLKSRAHLNNTVGYGQNMAGLGFNDYAGRLMQLSQIGASTAATAASANSAAGTQMGNTMMAGGQAQAAGVIGGANAINSTIGNTTNGLMLHQALTQNKSAYNPQTSWYGGPVSGAPTGYPAYAY